jgi:hypothetical protein
MLSVHKGMKLLQLRLLLRQALLDALSDTQLLNREAC